MWGKGRQGAKVQSALEQSLATTKNGRTTFSTLPLGMIPKEGAGLSVSRHKSVSVLADGEGDVVCTKRGGEVAPGRDRDCDHIPNCPVLLPLLALAFKELYERRGSSPLVLDERDPHWDAGRLRSLRRVLTH